jgi:hypothetical protein
MSFVLSVITGGLPTVRVALCEALPQVPVVVTATVWLPELSEPVAMLIDALSPLYGTPSNVHA